MENVNLTSQIMEQDSNIYVLDIVHAKTWKVNVTCSLEKQQVVDEASGKIEITLGKPILLVIWLI